MTKTVTIRGLEEIQYEIYRLQYELREMDEKGIPENTLANRFALINYLEDKTRVEAKIEALLRLKGE